MSGYLHAQPAARQKSTDRNAPEHRIGAPLAVHGDAIPSQGLLADAFNESPRTQSLLQMRQAFDQGPRVQSQLALQRALNRTCAPKAKEDEQPEQEARFEPAQLAAMPGEADPLPAPVQRKPNATGLPDQLKAGVEHLSGLAMDDVRVYTNSPKPAAVQAHAYAQGTDIHLAPGQEKHLPHEAWHVVQQKQGRVKPTLQAKGVAINDDAALEREADRMGRATANDWQHPENSASDPRQELRPDSQARFVPVRTAAALLQRVLEVAEKPISKDFVERVVITRKSKIGDGPYLILRWWADPKCTDVKKFTSWEEAIDAAQKTTEMPNEVHEEEKQVVAQKDIQDKAKEQAIPFSQCEVRFQNPMDTSRGGQSDQPELSEVKELEWSATEQQVDATFGDFNNKNDANIPLWLAGNYGLFYSGLIRDDSVDIPPQWGLDHDDTRVTILLPGSGVTRVGPSAEAAKKAPGLMAFGITGTVNPTHQHLTTVRELRRFLGGATVPNLPPGYAIIGGVLIDLKR